MINFIASQAGMFICFALLIILYILTLSSSFSSVTYTLDEQALPPLHAHDTDAGYDLRTPIDLCIPPKSSVTINTGVHFDIPNGVTGFIKSKSGLNIKTDIISDGVVDAGYTGEIVVKLRNTGLFPQFFLRGDKITQIVFLPVYTPKLKQGRQIIAKSERGAKGFGSSGK